MPGINFAREQYESTAGVHDEDIRRGFVAELRCPLAAWMERGPTIVRDHPVERVPITDRDPGPIPWWHAVGRDPGVDVTENGVPDEIMTFMTDSSSVAYYRFHGFATDKEAFVALSAASIAWAKSVDPEMWKR